MSSASVEDDKLRLDNSHDLIQYLLKLIINEINTRNQYLFSVLKPEENVLQSISKVLVL